MLQIFNSLTRKKEEFVPLGAPTPRLAGQVGMYTCGPTVYQYASIGNLRTYVTSDILRRVLTLNGYKVKAVMNITDVGHLVGDGDMGEDKLAKSAEKEHKTAWDIAKFYTEAFLQDARKLNIQMPDVMPRATEHIEEQIQLIKELENKGLTYKTSDGIYFNTVKYEEAGKKYGELSTLDEINKFAFGNVKAGARIKENPEKKNPRDFALWRFSSKPGERHMEWQSPWGLGFPGWHIECSAMSMKYLGETFDIHVGGEDLRQTHHPNEVAQSEGATGKKFVNYWVHGTFLLVDGKRMGKSEGNVYTVSDVEKKGFDPLALRYLYLTAHYRDPLNFTWQGLGAAQTAYERLQTTVNGLRQEKERTALSAEKDVKIENYRQQFIDTVNDDLNTPQALAVLWDMLKSNIPSEDKYDLALYYDEVLGLSLAQPPTSSIQLPTEVQKVVDEREEARKTGDFKRADELRANLKDLGYTVEDAESEPRVKKLRR